MVQAPVLYELGRKARWLGAGLRRRASHRLKRLRGAVTGQKVGFLIPGFAKAGTTALDEYLRDNPDVCMAEEKEPHFFSRRLRLRDGQPDGLAYQAYFSPTPRSRVLGEASTSYLASETLARIRTYNPSMKFILLLRHPVDRTYSGWNMRRNWRVDMRPFSEVIRTPVPPSPERLPLDPYSRRVARYVRPGRYLEAINALWSLFPPGQTLVIKSETMRARTQDTLDQVCGFLGVSPRALTRPREGFVGKYKSPMSPDDRRFLLGLFEEEVRGVEDLLGWDCSDWRE